MRLLVATAALLLLTGCGSSGTAEPPKPAAPQLSLADTCTKLADVYPETEFNIPSQAQLERLNDEIGRLGDRAGETAQPVVRIAGSRVARALAAFADDAEALPNVVVNEQMDDLVVELDDRCAPEGVPFSS